MILIIWTVFRSPDLMVSRSASFQDVRQAVFTVKILILVFGETDGIYLGLDYKVKGEDKDRRQGSQLRNETQQYRADIFKSGIVWTIRPRRFGGFRQFTPTHVTSGQNH